MKSKRKTKPSKAEFGNKLWLNGKGQLHRKNGPAVEGIDGRKVWFKNGLLHRTDGPAMVYKDGKKEYWLNNYEYPIEIWFSMLTSKEKQKAIWNM